MSRNEAGEIQPSSVAWRLSAQRLAAVAAATAYIGFFWWGYVSIIASRYVGWGLGPPSGPTSYIVISAILAILPAWWLPISLTRPSQVIVNVTYLILYVPVLVVGYGVTSPTLPPGQIFQLCLLIAGGMAIISIPSVLPLRRIGRPRVEFRFLVALLTAFALVLLAGFFSSEWQHVHLTLNFREIYDIRAALTERVETSGSRFVFYAQLWLAGFAFPLLFAIGAYTGRRTLAIGSLVAPVALYAVNGLKGMLFSPLYFLIVFFTCRWAKRSFFTAWAIGLAGACALGLLIDPALGLIGIGYTALLHFRTLSVPAQLLVQYFDFFATHPTTHLSHVQGISALIHYPYAVPIPEVIGTYYYGPNMKGANAGTWATDGLAAFGAIGILISSVMTAAVIYLLDCLAIDVDERLAATAVSYAAIFIASTSLFTTLVSGGLAMTMFAFWLWPVRGSTAVNAREEGSATASSSTYAVRPI